MTQAGQTLDRILVPVDGSDESFRAASFALGLAKEFGSEVILIHVLQVGPDSGLMATYGTAAADPVVEYLTMSRVEPQNWFARIYKDAGDAGVRVSAGKIIESPLSIVGEITDYAERNNVSLIVMGTRGRTGLKKLLLGSTASGVVTYAHCPVLIVR